MEQEWEQRRAEQDRRWEQIQQERGARYGYQGRRGYGYGYPARGPAYGYGGYPASPSRYGYGRGWDYPGYQAPAAAPESVPDEGGGGQSVQ